MLEKICKNCFEEMNSIPCPYCGYNGDLPEKGEILPPGTILNGKYMLGKVLGHGGFGITYLAYDMNFEVKVAIKEYYPDGLCTRTRDSKKIYTYLGEASDNYKYGLDKFVGEGKTMVKFRNLESIVDVRDYFRENNTAYLVMEYLEGIDLSGYLKKQPGSKLSLEETLSIITPILDTLEVVHTQGIIHRDISPDNIFITKDNKIKLLDFGAARYAISEKSKSLSVILKQGYAPPEQYSSRGKQGPWTDIYALGATIFRMLTGKVPLEAAERQMGDEEFEKDIKLLPLNMQDIIIKAMALKAADRFHITKNILAGLKKSYNIKGKGIKRTNKQNPSGYCSKTYSVTMTKAKKKNLVTIIVYGIIAITCIVGLVLIINNLFIKKYANIQNEDEILIAKSNALKIVNCLNAHNANENSNKVTEIINGELWMDFITLYNNENSRILSVDEFNAACENNLLDMSDDDFIIALQYITISDSSEIFVLKEYYNHINSYAEIIIKNDSIIINDSEVTIAELQNLLEDIAYVKLTVNELTLMMNPELVEIFMELDCYILNYDKTNSDKEQDTDVGNLSLSNFLSKIINDSKDETNANVCNFELTGVHNYNEEGECSCGEEAYWLIGPVVEYFEVTKEPSAPLWTKPTQNFCSKQISSISEGHSVIVIEKWTNIYGNIWYKTIYGSFIYEGNIKPLE